MTLEEFRALALTFEGAVEAPHFDRLAIRTPRKIFATLAPDGATANLLLDPAQQEHLVLEDPEAFQPVEGGWGRMGYTRLRLDAVDAPTAARALGLAHANALPKPRRTAKG